MGNYNLSLSYKSKATHPANLEYQGVVLEQVDLAGVVLLFVSVLSRPPDEIPSGDDRLHPGPEASLGCERQRLKGGVAVS